MTTGNSNTMKKAAGFFLIVLVALASSYLGFSNHQLQDLENRTWDWRLRFLAKRSQADNRIKLIVIDQSSIDYIAENDNHFPPWPREMYVPINEFLAQGQARAVAYDILFTEQSHYSVEDDEKFAQSMRASLPVVLAFPLRLGKGKIPEELLAKFAERQRFNEQRSRFSQHYLPNARKDYQSATLPIAPLLDAAYGFGNVSVPSDEDGVFRHIVTGQLLEDIPVLTLPFALYDAVNPHEVKTLPAFNYRGELAMRFAGPAQTYQTYPYAAILKSYLQIIDNQKPLIDPSEFRDSYVFVGMTAPGAFDYRPTPLAPAFPGVEYHANALDNLLNRNFVREATLLENILFTGIFLVLAVASALFLPSLRNQVLAVVLMTVLLISTSYYAALYGLWLQLALPLIAVMLAVGLALILQYQLEGAQVLFIKRAFRHYVSAEVIEQIISDPSVLSLGGQRRELSVFFCDIAKFSSISETLDPEKLADLLNDFLSEMTRIILSHGGTVDKYVGDAIIAFWNAPLENPEHAKAAVQAAVECQNRTEAMRSQLLEDYGHEIYLRIGIHTGIASVGNFGSRERFNYTAVGDTANLASRLEGANKILGTEILISESTFDNLKGEVECLRVATITVLGRDKPLVVYTPARNRGSSEVQLWNQMVERFEHGELEEAHSMIERLPASALKSFYQSRIGRAPTESGRTFDPVFRLLEK